MLEFTPWRCLQSWWTFGKDLFDQHQGLDSICKDLAYFCRVQAAAGRRQEVVKAAKSLSNVVGHLLPLRPPSTGALIMDQLCLVAHCNQTSFTIDTVSVMNQEQSLLQATHFL